MLKSGRNNKYFIAAATVLGLVGIVYLIGGIGMIYQQAFDTIQTYSERAFRVANQGSLSIKLRQLPVPINWIALTGFGQIRPFPFWYIIFEHRPNLPFIKQLFYLPWAIAGLFWFSVWMRLLRYPKRVIKFAKKYKYVVTVVLLYLVVVSITQSLSRRLMAVYPLIFMAYIYVSRKLFSIKELAINTSVYCLLIVVYVFMKHAI